MSVCESTTILTSLRVDHTEVPTTQSEPPRPERKPLTVTLSGKALTLAVLGITAFSHQQTIFIARFILLLTPIFLFVYNDYQNFLRLGPGGIPSTPRGYLKATWLSIWALKNPLEPPPADSSGILAKDPLPTRRDLRPATAGIAPHRQISQHGSVRCFRDLCQTLKSFASTNASGFETKTSLLEKHGLALFAKKQTTRSLGRGEICHVHDTDHSLHMFLHPDDIREVLEKGWGERHPMAWKWGPWKPVVGPFFVMIYAPRNETELRSVFRIVEAAVWNISGEEVQLGNHVPSP